MAFNSKRVDFPFYGVSLVTSPGFEPDKVTARVVLNLDPYKVVDGLIVRPMVTQEYIDDEGQPQTVEVVDRAQTEQRIYPDAYVAAVASPAKAQALALISQGIQLLIDDEV
jgi:hypothetical protein